MPGLPVVFGGAMIGPERAFNDEEKVKEVLDLLEKEGVKIIDSAQLYAGSEEMLGKANAGSRFTIDTKWKGGFAGELNTKSIVESAKVSLQTLGMKKVDIFYIHAPDASVPLDDWVPGVDEVYKAGSFARFGLSNFQAEDVEKVYNYSKEKGFVLPTVYQGNYSAVARKQDTLLFPLLRKLKMSFYAYSPIAGGFLVKTKEQIQEGVSRFHKDALGGMYAAMYGKPSYLEALAEWDAIAKEEGVSKAELAYRWVSYNSPLKPEYGDAIIVGSSKLQQLEETLEGLKKGPLSENAVKKIDGIWEKIQHEAPLDNYHR